MKKIYIFLKLSLICVFITNNFTSIAQSMDIITFAGGVFSGGCGDGLSATAARMYSPSGLYIDKYQNVYISDQNYCNVRVVNTTGVISTIAGVYSSSGGASCGYNGDGIPADSAQLNYPEGVAVDRYGNIFIADQFNNIIRKVHDNIIYTIAGVPGSVGDSSNGMATNALLWHPNDVSVDYAGNVYFVDMNNHKVKKVDTFGYLTTVAGVDTGIGSYSGDGGPATAAYLNFPQGIESDSMGNLYIADYGNNRIRRIDAITNIITTIAGNGDTGSCGNGGPATAACIWHPTALAIDKIGNLYIAVGNKYSISKVDTSGIITRIAGNGIQGYSGDGGYAINAELDIPQGVRPDISGNVYLADYENGRVRKIFPTPLSANAIASPALDWELYPNPSDGLFQIHTTAIFKNAYLQVYNIYGEKLVELNLKSINVPINLTTLPNGLYCFIFMNNEQRVMKKVIINH